MKKEGQNKRKWFFRNIEKIARVFKKKPEIINLNEEISDQAIYISNHSAASGPFTLELYFPKYFIPWGTHEMTEGYISRWKYLYYIFYQQKLGYGKFRSFVIATLFALISRMLYRGMGLIPTYKDSRLIKTFRKSIQKLDNNEPILIFPENSDYGYKDILEHYNPGFVVLSKMYYKRTGIDLPVYTIYYSKKHSKMIVEKPQYVNKMVEQGLSDDEISEYFKNKTNDLYFKYVHEDSVNELPDKESVKIDSKDSGRNK